MSYHYRRKRKRGLQRGEKLVLKYGIPATVVIAIIIQITIRGLPKFYDTIIGKLEEEAWRSRQIISGYAAKKAKEAAFRTEKNFQTNESFTIGSTYGSKQTSASKESLVKDFEEYRKNQRDSDDAIYQEIERREKKIEIEEYQKLFEEEKLR
jgi:hypothetical protein